MAKKSLSKQYDLISVSHYFYPRVGGLENMAYTVLTGFAQRGLKCLAVHGNGSDSFYQLNGFDCQSFHALKLFNGTYPVFGLGYMLYLLRLLRRNPQAIVLVYDRHLTSSFLTAVACRLTRHAYIVVHQTTNSSYFRSKIYERIANFLDQHVFRYVVLWADHSISVSEATKQFLVERYAADPAKFTVINNGFNEEVIRKFPIQEKQKLVVFAAKWIQVKDPDTVARAYLQLAKQYPDWQFIFAGEGSCVISDIGNLPENIDIIPRFFTQMELWDLFSKSAIYINASLHEGLALSIVEAAAQGNMLVLSDAPSNIELNTKLELQGNVFTRGNWEELAAKVAAKIESFGTTAHQAEIAQTIQLAHQRFTNSSVLEQYMEFARQYAQMGSAANTEVVPALLTPTVTTNQVQ